MEAAMGLPTMRQRIQAWRISVTDKPHTEMMQAAGGQYDRAEVYTKRN